MFLTTLYRIAKTSFKSFCRNWWLSLAATLIMVLTLITISFFVSLLVITNKTTESLRDKADLIVYFNDTASKDQIFALQNIIVSRADVKNVDYVSKEKALERWKSQQGNETVKNYITEDENPLPQSLEVKAQTPEDLDKINTYLLGDDYKPIIKQISYEKNKQLINKLVNITKFVKKIGYSLSIVFVLISVLIIYNTVRLTIFARSEEIDIMKLVGGSDWYIRGPFVLEGIGYGVLGAIISSIVFYFFFRLTIPQAETYLGLSNLNSSYLGLNVVLIILMQFLAGILLGGFCSVIAVKKHLK
jgi:cell division transport system permease protein